MSYSIDLNKITQEHITGTWQVYLRSNNKPGASDHFTHLNSLSIGDDSFTLQNGQEVKGKLTLARETKIIYNPQLKFYNNNEVIANAIITRLTHEGEKGKEIHKLTLYFSTGLELVLHKN